MAHTYMVKFSCHHTIQRSAKELDYKMPALGALQVCPVCKADAKVRMVSAVKAGWKLNEVTQVWEEPKE